MSALSLKNKLLPLLKQTFFIVLFLLCVPVAFAQKHSKNDLENKKKKLKEEINTINELLHDTKNSKKLSMNQVAILNKKINVREELIATISYEIKLINKEVAENQTSINNLKTTLEKLKKDYAAMIYFDYRNKDEYSRLMFLFAADNFNQAYQRYKYSQQIAEYRRKKAASIMETQTSINVKINELNKRKEDKRQLLTSEEQEKTDLAKEKTEQEGNLAQLQEKEKELKTDLDKKKEEIEKLNAAIKKLIQEELKRQQEEEKKKILAIKNRKEERAKKQKERKEKLTKREIAENKAIDEADMKETLEAEQMSEDFASNKGKLPWPVAKGVVTIGFGEQEHPTIKGFMINNNGVEIATAKGSSARAVFEGVVTGVTSIPGQGKIVLIRHGEYVSVYSNMEEVSVKVGDKVALKQSIGTVAYDSEDSRSSIMFQIWKGQKILNPEEWLYK
ncbi:MAG TPA: peptidoglycan DD-metalloendopeptidase family protein [Bacteroidia bacterium]|jgi:septal ring factor EnvC (AmiA/AmiB activator)|nr:peptidoglycan DD-metalloendopeptidase family protein [Bacteroidia bacterium]